MKGKINELPNIDTSRYSIDENGNVLKDKRMKTKREVLEHIAQYKGCYTLRCSECPYNKDGRCGHGGSSLTERLIKIGAMEVLRQNRKKFDSSKVLTCVTADKAKVGMRGYVANNLAELKSDFKNNTSYELIAIRDESYACRFETDDSGYALFYPIDEEVTEWQ